MTRTTWRALNTSAPVFLRALAQTPSLALRAGMERKPTPSPARFGVALTSRGRVWNTSPKRKREGPDRAGVTRTTWRALNTSPPVLLRALADPLACALGWYGDAGEPAGRFRKYKPEAQARGSGSGGSDADNMDVSQYVGACLPGALAQTPSLALRAGMERKPTPSLARFGVALTSRGRVWNTSPKRKRGGPDRAGVTRTTWRALNTSAPVFLRALADPLACASGWYGTEADTLACAFWCCAHQSWSGLEYKPEAQARGSGSAGSDADNMEGSQYVAACLTASARADPLACAFGLVWNGSRHPRLRVLVLRSPVVVGSGIQARSASERVRIGRE